MPDSTQRSFTASFTFDAELSDFLPTARRNRRLTYHFNDNPSIKDAIEAQGIPHTEVGWLAVNGGPVGFDYQLQNGDGVDVGPVNGSPGVAAPLPLRAQPPEVWRFVLDVYLGKLARLLRLLGCDALYRNDYHDREIVQVSVAEGRAVLTRDRRLLHARVLEHGYWVRSTDPEVQLAEVIRRFHLRGQTAPFSRCLACNGVMEAVPKEAVLEELEPKTRRYYWEFWRCAACGKLYWQGSHFDRLVDLVEIYTAPD
ncbi:MAG: twitching motility protein PilT [Chloroflexi bacterium]|nr:twitching motility protein PilT [Chloroflexota bacterium]